VLINECVRVCCSDVDKDSVWLIAPLIAKLSGVVQGRILKHAGQVLETGNNFWTAKNTKERERYLQKRHLALFFDQCGCRFVVLMFVIKYYYYSMISAVVVSCAPKDVSFWYFLNVFFECILVFAQKNTVIFSHLLMVEFG